MGKPPVIGLKPLDGRSQRGVERAAGPDGAEDLERGTARGEARRLGQPSVPEVGLDGTAISRRGIRPAR